MKTPVSIVHGEDIDAMVAEAIELLGGIEQFVDRGDTVLIKPNSFVKQIPANGNIARPEVVIALARLVRDAGAGRVIIGERNDSNFLANFADTGAEEVAELIAFDGAEHVTTRIEGAEALQMEVTLPKIYLEADKHMTVPVGKTHCGAGVTACLKNAMGLMVGGEPRKSHAYGICEVPIDVNSLNWPVLGLIDMTIAQEGNFPGAGGVPVEMGLLVASGDIVAADATCARLMGMSTDDVWMVRIAARRGFGVMDEDAIEIRGERIKDHARTLTGVCFDAGEFGEQVVWHIDDRCRYCTTDAVSWLRTDGGRAVLNAVERLHIVAGPVGDADTNGEPTVVIGNCNSWLRDLGAYVHGCPPAVYHIGGEAKRLLAE
ncbi:MAG: DUF362 domain-containing protein [Armatimonadota bacterium]|jgi:uncharacterized protein (DUF362 family)